MSMRILKAILLRSLAFVLSLLLLTATWIGIGFFGTGLLIELAYGPWEDQPLGSGLVLLFAMVALFPFYLFGISWLTRKLVKLFGATQLPPMDA
jgi:hypothetical protein